MQAPSNKVDPQEIFKELNAVCKEYKYKANREEQLAIRACTFSKPLIQMMMGTGSAMLAWGFTSIKPLRQYRAGRLMAAVGAGLWGVEAARFNSDLACVYTLASLPTPLGGEVAELIKRRDPLNPAVMKGPQRMEGDPGSRIATDAARLALQESQQGVAEAGASGSSGGSAAAGGEGLDAWGGETAAGSFWDLDAPQDPADGSGAKQATPQSRRDRTEARRHRRQEMQAGGGQDDALADYFDHRWDERPSA